MMSNRLRIPDATYRLQFNKYLSFRDARLLVAYLNRLGISDIYASPVLKARKGSLHGYDITDPTNLNPELGSEHEFNALVNTLRKRGMGLFLDVVPNHMASSPENPWWKDVIKKGHDSPFAGFFDTDWLNFEGTGGEQAGYRRFFDISDLIGVRVEDPQVFEMIHSLILRFISEGKVTGLRLDHIDGLYDPWRYLQRLQQRIAPDEKEKAGFYLIVEKILSGNEALTDDWPVQGTTGYDFMRILNAFFADDDGLNHLKDIYIRTTGTSKSFHDLVYENKRQVMLELFPEEVKALGRHLAYLSGHLTDDEASPALVEVTACLPVYRTYTREMTVNVADRHYIEAAVREATNRNGQLHLAINYLKQVLLLDFPAHFTREDKTAWLDFVMRWQQLTGAVMAKGFEDTALYNYNCLVSLDEVGGTPDAGGLSISGFHRWNLVRAERWPHSLNATSTHDTKRSEDVRARISVLSEIPDEWEKHLKLWMRYNQINKRRINGQTFPESNTEILLYQTLIGAWPLFPEEIMEFKERLKGYMIKAVREAKALTSWRKINKEYEDALLNFLDCILVDSANNVFFQDFIKFQQNIAYYGALNSLSQLLLKVTSPGVPDFYQGTELWNFSLVDPDNRRPVDFTVRKKLLDTITNSVKENTARQIKDMLSSWQDGRIKLLVTHKVLTTRRKYFKLFQRGDYLPLKTTGEKSENVCAFMRSYGEDQALVAVARFFTQLTGTGVPPIGEQAWRNDRILLPENAPKDWLNAFTGSIIQASTGASALSTATVFGSLPIALLISYQ